MTIQEAFSFGKQELEQGNIPDWQWDAEVLLEYILDCNRTVLLLEGKRELSEKQEQKYRDLIGKRLAHVPLQYLTGQQEFMGLVFMVSPAVLIPRQDTEVLVELVLDKLRKPKENPKKTILDLCTGSGCIAISLEKLGKDKEGKSPLVTAADISAQALEVARENGRRNESSVIFLESDLFDKVEGRFDYIVSNPPYIVSHQIDTLMEEVRFFEPRLALDGRADGLFFYDKIIKEAKNHLNENGWLFFEIGYDQSQAVSTLMERAGYVDIEVKKDLAGLDRVVYGRICDV